MTTLTTTWLAGADRQHGAGRGACLSVYGGTRARRRFRPRVASGAKWRRRGFGRGWLPVNRARRRGCAESGLVRASGCVVDPSGDLSVLAGIGLGFVVGLGAQLVSDALTGEGLSSWQTYLGAGVGGAVYGGVLAGTGNFALAGALGGAAGNATFQIANMASGVQQDGFHWGEFGVSTVAGALGSAVGGAVFGTVLGPSGSRVVATALGAWAGGAVGGGILGGYQGGVQAAQNGENVLGGVLLGTACGAAHGASVAGITGLVVSPFVGAPSNNPIRTVEINPLAENIRPIHEVAPLDIYAGAGNPAGFGRLIGWGTGAEHATARTASITLQEIQTAGITRPVAQHWLNFYQNAVANGTGGATAPQRILLMQRVIQLLGG